MISCLFLCLHLSFINSQNSFLFRKFSRHFYFFSVFGKVFLLTSEKEIWEGEDSC